MFFTPLRRQERKILFHAENGALLQMRIAHEPNNPFMAVDFLYSGHEIAFPNEIVVVNMARIGDARAGEVTIHPPPNRTFCFTVEDGFRIYYQRKLLVYGEPGIYALSDVKVKET